MCGRFDNLVARDAYRGVFKANRLPKSNFPLRYNIAPTDQIPIVRIDPPDREREGATEVPHTTPRAEPGTVSPCFERRSRNVAALYQRRVSTNGSNVRTVSSL